MKLAICYDNGEVFQHFGHTENFKIYDIEDGQIVSNEVVSTNGTGHEALAGMLADMGVSCVICGGMGQGAQDALAEAGIEVFTGVSGNADEAAIAFLAGSLISEGVNCDHHDHEEEHGCGGGCGSCGGGCGGGCGGCGPQEPLFEGPNAGKQVKVHYCGTLDDGTQFDSSYDRGEPLEFMCGYGMMIAGFDKAVATMNVGDIVNVHLEPEEAYGMPDPNAIFTIEISQMPGSENLTVGQHIYLSDGRQPFPVTVTAKEGTTITFDANHEMAGKALNFKIELVEVE